MSVSRHRRVAGRDCSRQDRVGGKVAPARVRTQKIPTTDGTAGFWNEYRITAQGKRIEVHLNGELISTGDIADALTTPGLIGVQYHTGKVQFCFIRIKRL